jgi:hypothetical protein
MSALMIRLVVAYLILSVGLGIYIAATQCMGGKI